MADQNFLDTLQYTENGVLRYEKIFGRTFVSTGGKQTTDELFAAVDYLNKDSCVLDIGCGIGGGMLYIARRFGCHVDGIDLSQNMISVGKKRLRSDFGDCDESLIRFIVGDALSCDEIGEERYDLIYSRDTILHIAEKDRLFARMLRYLKPNGRILISDYCVSSDGTGEPVAKTPEMAEYVKNRGYHLITVSQYGEKLKEAGFVNVEAIDATNDFNRALRRELDRLKEIKDEFLSDHSVKDYSDIDEGWNAKLARTGAKQQAWGIFKGQKQP